jgi:predicted enzyme related to lactoylglutathione lyase
MKLSGIMLGSDQPAKLADFYTAILGEPGYHEGDWYGYQPEDGGNLMIGSHSEVHGKNATPQRIMLTLEVDDVKAAFDKVKDAGGEVVAEPYQPGADTSPDVWLATLADPDGNYIQLARPWDA